MLCNTTEFGHYSSCCQQLYVSVGLSVSTAEPQACSTTAALTIIPVVALYRWCIHLKLLVHSCMCILTVQSLTEQLCAGVNNEYACIVLHACRCCHD